MGHDHSWSKGEVIRRSGKPHAEANARIISCGNGSQPPIVEFPREYVSRSKMREMKGHLRVSLPNPHTDEPPYFVGAVEAIKKVRPDADPVLLQQIGDGELSRDAYKLAGYVLGDRKYKLSVTDATSLRAVREHYQNQQPTP
jgi:hypothetical protein